jgi:hypothetical protein
MSNTFTRTTGWCSREYHKSLVQGINAINGKINPKGMHLLVSRHNWTNPHNSMHCKIWKCILWLWFYSFFCLPQNNQPPLGKGRPQNRGNLTYSPAKYDN